MKNIFTGSAVLVATYCLQLTVTSVALAQTGLNGSDPTAGKVGLFMSGVLNFINDILLPLILGLAFLMFVWGVFKFFILGGSDEEQQTKGRSLMIYAVAGFVLILAFYGIINVITNGLGLDDSNLNGNEVKTGFEIDRSAAEGRRP